MSQLVAVRTSKGLILAADRFVEVRDGAERSEHSAQKLWPLGTRAAIATSGAAVGLDISFEISRMLGSHEAPSFGALERWVMAVFQQRYDEYVRESASWFAAHPEALQRSFVLLGGARSGGGWGMGFHASERRDEPFHPLPVADVVTAPRRLGLEARLAAGVQRAGLDSLVETILTGLRAIAEANRGCRGPFDVVLFEGSGTTWTVVD